MQLPVNLCICLSSTYAYSAGCCCTHIALACASVIYCCMQACKAVQVLAEAVEGQDGAYEWGPKGLKPFDLPAPTAGGDVAAVKAGHVSISALKTGFIQPKM